MPTQVINNEFRDASREANWPFTADSALASGNLSLGFKMILDMVLYPVVADDPPYRLYKIDGRVEPGTVRFSFCDASYNEIGSTIVDASEEKFFIEDAYGMVIGTILTDATEVEKLLNKVTGSVYEFSPGSADLAPGVCCKIPTTGISALSCPAGVVVDPLNISASLGVNFELDGDDIKVNLYGELRTLNVPLKSINDISCKHFWLAAHPGPAYDEDDSSSDGDSGSSSETPYVPTSALRVVTSNGDQRITIGKERDFSYGE